MTTIINENFELIDKIIEKKEQNEMGDPTSFFEENIKGQSIEGICEVLRKYDNPLELLLSEETKDDGGIVAVSGFYFQFLVSLEYIIELIQGEWDYVLIDHHQDIIVINSEKIRIIQAKTKNVPYADVSQTDTYKDWVQKLFVLDETCKGYEQKREFELVTNFIIKNSRDVEGVEIYRGNDNFEMPTKRSTFFNKVRDFSNSKGYTVLQDEEYLEKLLSRFKITNHDTEGYIHKVTSMIGNLFDERVNGTKEDLDFLIGYICSVCYYPKNPSMQLIDQEKGLQIFEKLRERVGSDVRRYMKNEDSIEKINEYIEQLHTSFQDSPIYNHIAPCISEFESELKENIKENNHIYSVISRFIDRVHSSYRFRISNKDFMGQYIKELLDLTFLLKLSSGGKISVDFEHTKLLLKVIGNDKYSFFSLKDIDSYENGITKFKDTFKGCTFEEKRMLFDREKVNLFFSGDFDDEEFPSEYCIELGVSDNPTDAEMRDLGVELEKDSIAKVTYKVFIKNGSNDIKRKVFRKRMNPDFEEFKRVVKGRLG